MTGTKTIKERETLKERGKKRYIERRVQEEEAEKAIKEYQEPLDEFPAREDEPRVPS